MTKDLPTLIEENKRYGIKCSACGELIVSVHRHDFHYCKCGKTFVDGGKDYLRCGWKNGVVPPERVEVDPKTLKPVKND